MEPERRIEKLLRAFAKKRREQAGDPLELPPAARQRLHQEIAPRSAAERGGGFFSGLLLLLRPKLAFAICFIAIAAIGSWIFFPVLTQKKSARLASANSPSASRVVPPPVLTDESNRGDVPASDAVKPSQPGKPSVNSPTIASKAAEPLHMPKNSIAPPNSTAGVAVASAGAAANPVYKTEGTAVDSLANASSASKDIANRTRQSVVPPVQSSPPSVVAPTLAARDREKMLEAQKQPAQVAAAYAFGRFKNTAEVPAVSQSFDRAIAPAGGRPALALKVAAPVLTSFRVEQSGNDLRVIDADGSVYTGALQVARETIAAAATVSPAPKNKSAVPPQVGTSPEGAVQNYFFTVAGTNRNLNQNIVFSGNLIPLTNALPPSKTGSIGGALGIRRVAPIMSEPSLLSNSRILGKALIGNQKEIEVNATPAP
jgi:hypothetical protein